MAKFRKKPVEIEAITFEELVEYGRNNGANIVNGMPWSFKYNGHPITHENDECYLIPTLEGIMKFTPQDMLITGVNGEIYPCKIDIFEKTYDFAWTGTVKPTVDQVAWVLEKLCEQLHEGGTFRKLIYDRMGFSPSDYQKLYEAGGMAITNALDEVSQ